MKEPQTSSVVVDPKVIAKMLVLQAGHPQNEVGALLLGQVDRKELHVEEIVPAESIGSSVSVTFAPADFERAMEKAKKGQYTVGAAHGHPRYGAFLSSVDKSHQAQGQQLFADFVSLVIDPFRRDGVQFRFYRVAGWKVVEIPHTYGRKRWNTRGRSSSKAGTRKRFVRFVRVSVAAALVGLRRRAPLVVASDLVPVTFDTWRVVLENRGEAGVAIRGLAVRAAPLVHPEPPLGLRWRTWHFAIWDRFRAFQSIPGGDLILSPQQSSAGDSDERFLAGHAMRQYHIRLNTDTLPQRCWIRVMPLVSHGRTRAARARHQRQGGVGLTVSDAPARR